METTGKKLGISIVIPTHNRAAILAKTLASVAEQIVPRGTIPELVVVANACTDETEKVVSESAVSRVMTTYCAVEREPGLSIARNRGVAEAKHDVIVFLDDDVLLESTWLDAHSTLFDTKHADISTGRIELWWEGVSDPGFPPPRGPKGGWLTEDMRVSLGWHDLGPGEFELKDDRIRGGNFGFRREVFEKVGPFNPGLGRKGKGLLSGEESLFARDALAAGFKIWYSQSAAVRHLVTAARLEPGYLARVARSMSYSIARMKERPGVAGFVRGMGMGAARAAGHTLGRAGAVIRNDFGAGVRHRVKTGVGLGQMAGTWARAVGGPIAAR